MSSRAIVPQQQRGGPAAVGKQKAVPADGNNRRALGDIGNLVNVRGTAIEGKLQQQITRPITRSFCAQLLANAQAAAAANNKKSVAIVADVGVKAKGGAKVAKQKVTVKPKPEKVIEISPDTEEEAKKSENKSKLHEGSSRKKVETLTSILTARSKVACGLTTRVTDIDAVDAEDQLAVVDYVEDIYKFYRLAETASRVHDYMDTQLEINEKMRSILVDWLIEVHNKFELMPETLYLTIHIVDRYLSMKTVLRRELQLVGITAMLIACKYEEIWAPERELQLVGITAMLIACKYEEIWAPEVNDFICISDRAYNREQILGMEKSILNKLEWSLTFPTQYQFLVRFLKAAAASSDKEMENMVFFFAELALMQYSTIIMYCPSMVAASAVYVAHCTLKKTPSWSGTLKHYTGFSEPQLMDCAKMLVKFHSLGGEGKLKVVYRKYSCAQRGAVALHPPAEKLLERELKVGY